MIIKLDAKALLLHQISSFYLGELTEEENKNIEEAFIVTLKKLDYCFSHIKNKYYHINEETVFNCLHVAQWTMFLYTISNTLNKYGNTDLCDKIYGISIIFSSADIFYGVQMPDIWFFDHPQGSVLGRAKYSNYFTFSQGCTVGNNKGKYPVFEEHVSMFSNSKVLGDCHVGNHVIFAANSFVIDSEIPSYSIVFGQSPNNTIKPITPEKFSKLTGSMFHVDE